MAKSEEEIEKLRKSNSVLAVRVEQYDGWLYPEFQLDGCHIQEWVSMMLNRMINPGAIIDFLIEGRRDLDGESLLKRIQAGEAGILKKLSDEVESYLN